MQNDIKDPGSIGGRDPLRRRQGTGASQYTDTTKADLATLAGPNRTPPITDSKPVRVTPPFRVLGQLMEFFVMSGVLRIDEVEVPAGRWARVLPSNAPVEIGTVSGAEIIAIVRGEVERLDKENFGEQK